MSGTRDTPVSSLIHEIPRGLGTLRRELGMKIRNIRLTLLYLRRITNNDLLCCTGNSAHCYVAAWMGGGIWARMDTYVSMADPFAVHLKLLQHCLLAIPNIK